MSRLNTRRKAKNANELYDKIFEDRGVNHIEQFATPRLSNPSKEEIDRIPTVDYIWRIGDKYWLLAAKFLGDQSLWWLIAKINNKPAEFLLNEGDKIKIPTNVAIALEVLG